MVFNKPIFKQQGQCAYNVTLRRIYETTVTVEKQRVLHISVCVYVCVGVGVGVGARTRACSCATVALLMKHATRIRRIVFGLSGSAIFFDIIS
jgi:hypothetical protein